MLLTTYLMMLFWLILIAFPVLSLSLNIYFLILLENMHWLLRWLIFRFNDFKCFEWTSVVFVARQRYREKSDCHNFDLAWRHRLYSAEESYGESVYSWHDFYAFMWFINISIVKRLNWWCIFFKKKDAADKCVSVDFAVFQQKSIHLTDTRENINNFRRCISHLDNCSVQTYIPGQVLSQWVMSIINFA